jgi:flagellar hook-basal body complex protein FliE
MSAPLGLHGVLALRAEILERSRSLSLVRGLAAPEATARAPQPVQPEPGFATVMAEALRAVNALQAESGAQGAAYERGETHDIASVMLSRQKASIAFEATLQARNRLLAAYRDIMNMPV